MSRVAYTKLLPDTAKTGVNRNGSTISKDRLVSVGTPTGQEFAIDGANVGGVSTIVGAIQEDVESGKTVTVYGPGSIVQLENDGTGTLAYGVELYAVAGASLAASGRVRGRPATTGHHTLIGRCLSRTTVAASAGAKVLVELFAPTPVYVP